MLWTNKNGVFDRESGHINKHDIVRVIIVLLLSASIEVIQEFVHYSLDYQKGKQINVQNGPKFMTYMRSTVSSYFNDKTAGCALPILPHITG